MGDCSIHCCLNLKMKCNFTFENAKCISAANAMLKFAEKQVADIKTNIVFERKEEKDKSFQSSPTGRHSSTFGLYRG